MFSIGLTGGIGSGKSRVADLLQAWGVPIIDTDVIAHALTAAGGAAIAPIREAFGAQALALTGAMDRGWMRAHVFEHPDARIRLQGILHPLINRATIDQAHQAHGDYVVFVVPLLVESGRWVKRVDRVAVVDCEPEVQRARVQARSGLTVDTIARIMATQASRPERLAVADDVIFNGAGVSAGQLEATVQRCHQHWLALAKASPSSIS